MGGKSESGKTTSQPPEFVLNNLRNLGDAATELVSKGSQQYDQSRIAGFTPTQMNAFSTIDNLQGLGQAYINPAAEFIGQSTANPLAASKPYADNAFGAYQKVAGADPYGTAKPFIDQMTSANLSGVARPYLNNATNMSVAGAGQPLIQAATSTDLGGAVQPYTSAATSALNPANFSQYMSPYTQQVVDATQRQFSNQNEQARQQLVGNAIASGAWGGDRAGVAQAILANQQQLAQAPAIANLYNQGWTQAGNLAAQQAGINLGAGQLTNQALAGQAGLALQGAGLAQSGTQADINKFLSAGQQATGAAAQQAALEGQAAQLSGNIINQQQQNALGAANGMAGLGQQAIGATNALNQANLQAGLGLGQLGQQAQNLALSGANAQLQSGTMQQQLAQQALTQPYQDFMQAQSYPYQALNWLGKIYTGAGAQAGGTSTTTQPNGNIFSDILGSVGTILPFFMANSGGRIPKRDSGGIVPVQGTPIIPNIGAGGYTVGVPAGKSGIMIPRTNGSLFSAPSATVSSMTGGPAGLGTAFAPLPVLTPKTTGRPLTLPESVMGVIKNGMRPSTPEDAPKETPDLTKERGGGGGGNGGDGSGSGDGGGGGDGGFAFGGAVHLATGGLPLDDEESDDEPPTTGASPLPYRAPLVDWQKSPYAHAVTTTAEKYKLDPNLFGRILAQESGAGLINGTIPTYKTSGYHGLGQISPDTAKDLGFDIARLESDPDYSIDSAGRVFRAKLDAYGNDPRKAYLAYVGANPNSPGPLGQANLRNVFQDQAPSAGVIPQAAPKPSTPAPPATEPEENSGPPSPKSGRSIFSDDNPYAKQMQDGEVSPWLSVAKAGAAMLAGRNSNALRNIGAGVAVGLDDYTKRKQSAVEQARANFSADRQARALLQQGEQWRQTFGLQKERLAETVANNLENRRLRELEIASREGTYGGADQYKFKLWQSDPANAGKSVNDYLRETTIGKVVAGQLIDPRTGAPRLPGAGGPEEASTEVAHTDDLYPDIPPYNPRKYAETLPINLKAAVETAKKESQELGKKAEAAQASSSELETLRSIVNKPDFNTDAFTPVREKLASTVFAVSKQLGADDKEAKDLTKNWTGMDLTDQSIFNKVTTQGGLQNARNLEGAREAYASILIALKAWPSGTNTTESNRLLVDLLDAPNKWLATKQDYERAWAEKHNHDLVGFNAWFNRTHPADEFASKVVPYQLPKSKSALKLNTTYQLANGQRGKWTGKAFELED